MVMVMIAMTMMGDDDADTCRCLTWRSRRWGSTLSRAGPSWVASRSAGLPDVTTESALMRLARAKGSRGSTPRSTWEMMWEAVLLGRPCCSRVDSRRARSSGSREGPRGAGGARCLGVRQTPRQWW